MAKKYDVCKCEKCGNVLMVLDPGTCDAVCCGDTMSILPEQSADSSTEKHVPVIEKTKNGFLVTVGSTLHPMMDNHWIQWIELVVDGNRMLKELKPGDEPKAEFCCCADCCPEEPKSVVAREYCNVHGLWKGEL